MISVVPAAKVSTSVHMLFGAAHTAEAPMRSLKATQNSLPPSACTSDMMLAASGAFEILGALCFCAAIIPSAKQPKLFWVLWLLSFMLFGRASFGETPVGVAWLHPEPCNAYNAGHLFLLVLYGSSGLFFLVLALVNRRMTVRNYRNRIVAIEGDLCKE